jgi:hypothetical protein
MATNDVVTRAIVDALTFLTMYVEEREVPDDIADDDVKALESVAAYLLEVPEAHRPRLVELVGPRMASMCGLVEHEPRRLELSDLPPHLIELVRAVGQPDPEAWVHMPIPALNGDTVMQVHAIPGGDERLRDFLRRAKSKFE